MSWVWQIAALMAAEISHFIDQIQLLGNSSSQQSFRASQRAGNGNTVPSLVSLPPFVMTTPEALEVF